MTFISKLVCFVKKTAEVMLGKKGHVRLDQISLDKVRLGQEELSIVKM